MGVGARIGFLDSSPGEVREGLGIGPRRQDRGQGFQVPAGTRLRRQACSQRASGWGRQPLRKPCRKMRVHVGAPNVLPWSLQDGEMCEWVKLTEATGRLKRIQAPGSGG